ncbi:MAG TPA: MlaD family protein [Thermoleophilaceae bacterium]|jgi:phospholipid/cholesterol/gamma-HCH transport system substrate-binding protein|nr:MlaD family protein [Thermoleophilaceae bacterium]
MRAFAFAALLAAAVALFVVLNNGGSREYQVMMQNAGQLVPGDVVRIGGVQAGSVTGLDLTPNGQADVTIALGKDWGRLHAGTRATVRSTGIATVTGRYVDISPGPSFRPALPDGGAIDVDHTESIVDIDQLLNAFTPRTRGSLRDVIDGFSTWYSGREAEANASAHYFPATLQSATDLFQQLGADSGTLEQFITQTGIALRALSRRGSDLTALVSDTRATAHALSADNESLSTALRNVPPALRAGSDAFASVRAALPELSALVRATDPVSRQLAPFFRDLQPVVSRAVPAFRDFRLAFDRPGNADDLYDALRTLPSLGRLTDKAFPQAEKTLADSTPVFSFIRPYTPDLVGFVRSFGSAASTYDANGHYARTVPVFDAFNFTDDANGGTLTLKDSSQRGKSPYLTTGHLRRCPGASLPPLSDSSTPFVDTGALATPDCDPTDVIK